MRLMWREPSQARNSSLVRPRHVTGALADGWIPSLGSAPPGQVTSMRDKIFASAAAAGRAPEEITCAYHLEVDPSHSAPDKPWVVSGPTGKIAETLAGFAGLGFTALSLVPGGPDRAETVQLLAADILPAVRDLVAAGERGQQQDAGREDHV